jgi:hypothetical protein
MNTEIQSHLVRPERVGEFPRFRVTQRGLYLMSPELRLLQDADRCIDGAIDYQYSSTASTVLIGTVAPTADRNMSQLNPRPQK